MGFRHGYHGSMLMFAELRSRAASIQSAEEGENKEQVEGLGFKPAAGAVQVMGFRHGYHGSMLMFSEPSSPVNAAFDFVIAEYNDCEAAEALVETNRDSLACVILEGMLGSGGCIPASDDFVQTLRRATLQVAKTKPLPCSSVLRGV